MKTKLALSIILFTLFFINEKGMAQAPGWAWAKGAVGGNSLGFGRGLTVDANGNSYVIGFFSGQNITFGSIVLTNTNVTTDEIFIVKYDASGNQIWAKSITGKKDDYPNGITLDMNGNLYVTGSFKSPALNFDSITLIPIYPHRFDVFIAKYDSSGNVLWAKNAGGEKDEFPGSISVDHYGNSFITGYFESPEITFGNTTLINSNVTSNTSDIFIVKYDASGNVLWAKKGGGVGSDLGISIVSDAYGNSYTTGYFDSDTLFFDNHIATNYNSSNDVYIVKYDSSGNFKWIKSIGGADDDKGSYLGLDSIGNLYHTGFFSSPSVNFDTTTLTTATSYYSFFIAKYDSSGNLIWAKSEGGLFNIFSQGLAVDAIGNTFISGEFNIGPATIGNTTLNIVGYSDIMVVKFDTLGNAIWAKGVGGADYEGSRGIGIDANGNVYATGIFLSPNLSFDGIVLSNNGGGNVFIAKLDNPTGITEQNPNNNLTLYPNPATDFITIETNINKKQVITISDITGKIIYSTTTLSDKTIINTKDFSQGVYAVQVQAGDAVEIRKIVVAR